VTLKEELAALRAQIKDLETRQDNSERFQSWVMGGLGVLGVLFVFMADKFKKILGFG
jgi:hypothetical protein